MPKSDAPSWRWIVSVLIAVLVIVVSCIARIAAGAIQENTAVNTTQSATLVGITTDIKYIREQLKDIKSLIKGNMTWPYLNP